MAQPHRVYEQIQGIDYLDMQEWDFQELLASSNNSVFSYSSKKNPNHKIAVKEINYRPEHEQEMFNKLYILQKIKEYQHENIIYIYGAAKVIKRKIFGEDYSVVIGMEQAEGNLEDFSRMKQKQQQSFTKDEITQFLGDILSAMSFLQKKMIAHRDIKPENILIIDGKFKLGDLDDVKQRGNKTEDKSIVLGTIQFSAPELIKAMKKNKQNLSYNAYKCDLYSFGLCLLYMCTMQKFKLKDRIEQTREEKEEFIRLKCKDIKENYSKIISKTVKFCLVDDPYIRPDIMQVYKRLVEKGVIEDDLKRVSPSLVKERPHLQEIMNRQFQTSDNTTNNYISQNHSFATHSQYLNDQTDAYTSGTCTNNNSQVSVRQQNRQTMSISQILNNNRSHFTSDNSLIMSQKKDFKSSYIQQSNSKNNNNINSNRQSRSLLRHTHVNKQFESMQSQGQHRKASDVTQSYYEDETDEENVGVVFQENLSKTRFSQQKYISQSNMKSQIRFQQCLNEIKHNNNEDNIQQISFTRKQKLGIFGIIFFILSFLIAGVVILCLEKNKTCQQGEFKFKNKCVSQCQQGYFGDEVDQTCKQCIENCLQCTSDQGCQQCEDNYLYSIQLGLCYKIDVEDILEEELLSEINNNNTISEQQQNMQITEQ